MDEPTLTIDTGALQPGVTLAAAVLDGSGQVLLPAGTVLDESAIGGLRQQGVEVVCIAQREEEVAWRRTTVGRIEELFRRAGDSEPAARLKRAVLEHRLEHCDGR